VHRMILYHVLNGGAQLSTAGPKIFYFSMWPHLTNVSQPVQKMETVYLSSFPIEMRMLDVICSAMSTYMMMH